MKKMTKSASRSGGVSVVAPLDAGEIDVPQNVEAPRRGILPPTSARQWVEVSMLCLKNRNIPPERLLEMLEETAKSLLAGKDQPNSRPTRGGENEEEENDGRRKLSDASETGSSSAALTVPTKPNPQRWLAARFFMLASHHEKERGRVSSLRNSVRLAELAVDAHHCPLTTTHLAWACYHLGAVVQDTDARSTLEKKAKKLARRTLEMIAGSTDKDPTNCVLLVKLGWLMATLGETESALSLVHDLLEENHSDVNAWVLFSLLSSATGDYDKALEAACHAEQFHPQYIVSGLLLIMMQYVTSTADPRQLEGIEELLLVLVARVQATAQYMTERVSSDEFFLSPDIGTTVIADGSWSSRESGTSRVAGHWALLAHVALEVDCASVADVVVAAGLDYVNAVREEHGRAYADLVCCAARLKIDRIERIVEALRLRHRADGLGGLVAELREFEDERLMQEQQTLLDDHEILSLQSMLFTALEACDAHAESYVQLGRLYLLEALRANQPHALSATRLVEAAHYFQLAILSSPTLTAAYEGMGRVRETQGTMELSLEFMSSAAELAARQPVIPFERFLYILQ